MNYYPFHIGDYLSATRHLSWEEDCAYRRLLDVYYTSEKPLPAELKQVCRLVLATTDGQREAVATVLEEFFEATPEGWINSRADAEIERMSAKREKARESAKVGVQARVKKNAELRAERMAEARAKGMHTPSEWAAMLDMCDHACVRCGATGDLQKDHITPVYQGGSDGINNLQPLCKPCNTSKGPESIDHRPESIRAAFAQSAAANASDSGSERSATNTNTNTISPNGVQGGKPPKPPAFEVPDWMPVEQWAAFVEMRRAKGKRAPFTLAAAKGIVGDLDRMRRQGQDVGKVLQQSTTNGWSGVFDLKSPSGRSAGPAGPVGEMFAGAL